MQREASLHIRRSSLVSILEDMLPKGVDSEKFADILLERSAPLSTSTRSVVTTNKRLDVKTEKIAKSSRLDSDILAKLIYATRHKLKHRGITQIKPGGKDWDVVKEITNQALDFCLEFNIEKRAGMIKYLEIGISKMNKFNLNKLPSLNEAIYETYAAQQEVDEDDDPTITEAMYKEYSTIVLKQTGIFEDFKNDPVKYVWFCRARKQAKELNIALDAYIEAQFEGLDFARGIPAPSQLVGPKATERIYKYLYKYNLRLDKKK